MNDLSSFNPTGRFTGLAGTYAKHRPDYPAAAIEAIVDRCGLDGSGLLVDVGCGTGISSRLFARRGIRVLGIEPNADMLARAAAAEVPPDVPRPEYVTGRAEATGLANGSATVVLAAQAFHWFQPEAALREFHRILRPSGWVALVWNERDESDSFTAAYGVVIRSTPETASVEGPRGRAGEALLVSRLFEAAECLAFSHEQILDEEGVLGRAFSASYAPREPDAASVFAAALRAVFARFQQDGSVRLRYVTSVYLGRRPG
jgi:SAM-dependent methyltransferase